jgi:hypothetical protein
MKKKKFGVNVLKRASELESLTVILKKASSACIRQVVEGVVRYVKPRKFT